MKPHDDPGLLTDKQERFVNEYLIDQNASAAAIRAGYAEGNSRSQGADLLRNPAVKARVREELASLFGRLKISAFSLLQERARAAFFDPGKLFDASGKPIPLHELDPDTRAALQIAYSERSNGETVTRVRQPSRAPALAALEKRYAQFLELMIEPHAPTGLPDSVREFDERMAREKQELAERRAARAGLPPGLPQPGFQARPISQPAPAAPPAPVPGPSLTQRAAGALKQLVQGKEAASKPAAPARNGKHGKYWVNLHGEVDLTHPDVPPNVRQRLEQKKREEEAWLKRRDQRRLVPDVREDGPLPDDGRPKYAITGPVFEDS